MLALQPPPRNLLSTRVPRVPAAYDVSDYLAPLRGTASPWGTRKRRSPQWHAAAEIGHMQLATKLADRLYAMTGLRSLPASARADRVVARYLADAAALGDQLDAINRLFATVADSQTLAAPGGFDPAPAEAETARAAFAATLFAGRTAADVFGPHVVTASLLATPDRTRAACEEDLARRCGAIGDYAVRCLSDGLTNGLLGVAVWPAADACWYARSERVCRPTARGAGDVYKHWHVCKEVHLMDAAQLGGVPGWLDMPPAAERVVSAVPPLLHPHLGTVVGTMVRERTISWVVGKATYPREQVRPQKELIVDRAVVIGSVVLTGWESAEHRRPGWWMRLDRYLAGRGGRATARGVRRGATECPGRRRGRAGRHPRVGGETALPRRRDVIPVVVQADRVRPPAALPRGRHGPVAAGRRGGVRRRDVPRAGPAGAARTDGPAATDAAGVTPGRRRPAVLSRHLLSRGPA